MKLQMRRGFGLFMRDPLDVIMKELPVEKKKITVDRYEGPNRDYWEPTAANAILAKDVSGKHPSTWAYTWKCRGKYE